MRLLGNQWRPRQVTAPSQVDPLKSKTCFQNSIFVQIKQTWYNVNKRALDSGKPHCFMQKQPD